MVVALSANDVVNRVKLDSDPRKVSTSVNTVAWLEEVVSIPASSSIGFWLSYVDPVEINVPTPAMSLTTPVRSTDWLLNTASDGSGSNSLTTVGSLNITMFAESAVASLFNGSGVTAYVNKFQIRGFSVQGKPHRQIQTDNTSSQSVYGLRDMVLSNDMWRVRSFMQDLSQMYLDDAFEPHERVDFSFVNEFDSMLIPQVGDLVRLVNEPSQINSVFSISGVRHDVQLAAGLEHRVTYRGEYFANRNWLILDHLTYGKLDSGRTLAL